eukprot:TRINITY_DN3098_c0_g3_i1.p1 TRINITY_DN3098_c0_g3~~TRINITY_DN3098_c0_g3_i1.p1  ORF type:complete len:159 (-),score=48.97 TRINITY_DN3098_c0_g3_i1:276-752(-)
MARAVLYSFSPLSLSLFLSLFSLSLSLSLLILADSRTTLMYSPHRKERKINFATFQEALDALAQKKGISVIDLENKILAAGGPSSSGTKAVNSGITAKLTDSSQYTGSHQHRFDKDGKGRGLDGRDSVATGTGTSTQQIGGGGSGYVSGYSNQGTYGK